MSDLGNKLIFASNLQYYMDLHKISRNELCARLGFPYSTVSEWLNGKKYPRIDKIELMAALFDIQKSDLIEHRSDPRSSSPLDGAVAPTVTTSVVLCGHPDDRPAILGDMEGRIQPESPKQKKPLFLSDGTAKLRNDNRISNWEFDQMEVPASVLDGHDPSDFFVLRAPDDSMTPHFLSGDPVLFLKQDAIAKSGDLAAVVISNVVTVRKILFIDEHNWIRLTPTNATFSECLLDDEDRPFFRILGVPKFVSRIF